MSSRRAKAMHHEDDRFPLNQQHLSLIDEDCPPLNSSHEQQVYHELHEMLNVMLKMFQEKKHHQRVSSRFQKLKYIIIFINFRCFSSVTNYEEGYSFCSSEGIRPK